MKFLGLFEGYGIELEYMIVDAAHLDIMPIADKVLSEVAGHTVGDFEDGDITWSNELVLHVLELKTSGPAPSLNGLEASFQRSLKKLASYLAKHKAALMPTAMHPLMNPSEMRLWPHDSGEIYQHYNRIFDCRGHGWSNLQSMHINLPFRDDTEFGLLHSAIRFLLPIIPALSASSPVVEGHITGAKDNRLLYYQKNQSRIPSISGLVIPEPVTSMTDYRHQILNQMYAEIAPHDPEELLQEEWLNSRGAIARFERQTIEIRVIDLQETPIVDLAIADLIVGALKELILRKTSNSKSIEQDSLSLPTEQLKIIFDTAILFGEAAPIVNSQYLQKWSAPKGLRTLGELWSWIFEELDVRRHMSEKHQTIMEQLLRTGTLASRLTTALGPSPNRMQIQNIYRRLCACLEKGELFVP